MKNIAVIITIILVTKTFNCSAQTVGNLPSDSTINHQTEWLFKKSYSYQDNKVISKTKYLQLQKNVNDTISKLKTSLLKEEETIKNQLVKIVDKESEISILNNQITQLNNEKDGILFLGTLVTKKSYNLYLWSTIGLLCLALVFFIFKFKNSNFVTSKTKKEFDKLQSDFDIFRKKSLEKEQVIMRKLQDELNKK